MERRADVVVVGAGIVGCATAYFLARRGQRVAVVERAPVAGEQSRKNWGFVRQQGRDPLRSEEHTSELQSLRHLVCRLLLEKKKNRQIKTRRYIEDHSKQTIRYM